MFRDWCPLCGGRFQGDTPKEVIELIIAHTEEKNGNKSDCEKNWRLPEVVLKDDTYETP